LLVAGNHKPGLRSVDEAIRRRLHLIPFTVTIPPGERDDTLTEKLKAEWGGILSWMIEGCREWQQRGLGPPKAVEEATAAYLESEDALNAWIDAACERDYTAWETSSHLFFSWKAWADGSGELAGTLKRFVQSLEAHGFTPQRKAHGRGFAGLKIIQPNHNNRLWNER
jgi:putative DNA primase/helicase